jgi:hypothetical protein
MTERRIVHMSNFLPEPRKKTGPNQKSHTKYINSTQPCFATKLHLVHVLVFFQPPGKHELEHGAGRRPGNQQRLALSGVWCGRLGVRQFRRPNNYHANVKYMTRCNQSSRFNLDSKPSIVMDSTVFQEMGQSCMNHFHCIGHLSPFFLDSAVLSDGLFQSEVYEVLSTYYCVHFLWGLWSTSAVIHCFLFLYLS